MNKIEKELKHVEEELEGKVPHPEPRRLRVVVDNEDDGDQYRLEAGPGGTLASIIKHLYAEKLRRERRPDDRLRCESGEDVLVFEAMTFKAYLAAGHCPELHWLFAGATGGA